MDSKISLTSAEVNTVVDAIVAACVVDEFTNSYGRHICEVNCPKIYFERRELPSLPKGLTLVIEPAVEVEPTGGAEPFRDVTGFEFSTHGVDSRTLEDVRLELSVTTRRNIQQMMLDEQLECGFVDL